MLLRKHSTSTSHQFLPFLTNLPLLLFPPCWQRSFVLPKAAVLCREPAATPSWLISSNSCSPLHVSKQRTYFKVCSLHLKNLLSPSCTAVSHHTSTSLYLSLLSEDLKSNTRQDSSPWPLLLFSQGMGQPYMCIFTNSA